MPKHTRAQVAPEVLPETAYAIADELIGRVAPLAAHDDVPLTLPLFKWRNLLAEAAASIPGITSASASASASSQAAPINFDALFAPGDDLHHAVILAFTALRAIADAAPVGSKEAGLFHAVRFIADGLRVAALAFEENGLHADREGDQ